MAYFYLIDQSFRDEGSHHGDYVHCVGWAAKEAGFNVIVGAHRQLSRAWSHSILSYCTGIKPVFRNTTYQGVSELAGIRRMKGRPSNEKDPNPSSGTFYRWVQRFKSFQAERRRESLIGQFARDCAVFFQNLELTREDHVFFASISDLELIGLARFLARAPRTLKASWHVQFHFNLFDGRPPDYDRQFAAIQPMRVQLGAALASLAYHNLNLYTTTDELTDQFNHLGISHFQTLAYPIAKEFAPSTCQHNFPQPSLMGNATFCTGLDRQGMTAEPSLAIVAHENEDSCFTITPEPPECRKLILPPAESAPLAHARSSSGVAPSFKTIFECNGPRSAADAGRMLKVVCPGAVRREKGQEDYLQILIDQIKPTLLANRQIQLIAQVADKKFGERERLCMDLPETSTEEPAESVFKTLPHPLPRMEYCNLIRESDIGLLFYNSEIYFSRRAGVLGELLSAGKPVVVPAGSWLAEQIAEPGFRYAEQYFANRDYRTLSLADFNLESTNAPMHGGVINFDDQRRPFRFDLPISETDSAIAVHFDWHWPLERGLYCRIELELFNKGRLSKKSCQVVGHRGEPARKNRTRKPLAIFPVHEKADTARITLKNAFHHSSASLRNLQLWIAKRSPGEPETESIPRSSVGVIAPDRDHLGECLTEIVNHFEHYRQSAEQFSHRWYARHHPRQTIVQLTSAEALAAEVA
jgi:hypothetical protein